MRVLFLVAKPAYPPRGGSSWRNWQNIVAARQAGAVGVFAVFGDDEGTASPAPDVDWQRTHIVPRMGRLKRWRAQLRLDGFPISERAWTGAVARDLERALDEFRPDVAVFAEPWLWRYLPIVEARGCRIVHDSHNAEVMLREKIARTRPSLRQRLRWYLSTRQLRAVEGQFCARADQIWACSDIQAGRLRTLYHRIAPIEVIPNGADLGYYTDVREERVPSPPGWQAGPTVAFVGAYNYPPNLAAARTLIQDIFPRVKRRVPNARLLLVGRAPTPELLAASSADVVVAGAVDDVRPWIAAATVIATPLDIGGGTRLKIVEAFACKRPVVSTAKGCEGLPVEEGTHYLRADDAETAATAIARLLENPAERQALAERAWELVQGLSHQAVGQQVRAALAKVAQARAKT